MGVEEDVVVPPAEVVAEAPVNEDPPQKPASLTSTATEVPERRKSGRLSAMPKVRTRCGLCGSFQRQGPSPTTTPLLTYHAAVWWCTFQYIGGIIVQLVAIDTE